LHIDFIPDDAIKTFCGVIAAIVGLVGMLKTYVKLKKS
jgi:hypothetical protein